MADLFGQRIDQSYIYVLNSTPGTNVITNGNGSPVDWDASQVLVKTGLQTIDGQKNFVTVPQISGLEILFKNNGLSGLGEATSSLITNDSIGAAILLGDNNLLSGKYSIILAGEFNKLTGNNSLIGAGKQNSGEQASLSFIGAGSGNLLNNTENSAILVGKSNTVTGSNRSSILAGQLNLISGASDAAIGGGAQNEVKDLEGFIGGGNSNKVLTRAGAILGGSTNTSSGQNSMVGGGTQNLSLGSHSAVLAGRDNVVNTGESSAIIGGDSNLISGDNSAIGAGSGNNVTGNKSTIIGGENNLISGNASVIGGGTANTLSGNNNVLGGGASNTLSGNDSVLVGGSGNSVFGDEVVLIGGKDNTASGQFVTLFAGENNNVTGTASTIVAGRENDILNSNDSSITAGNTNFIKSSFRSNMSAGTGNTLDTVDDSFLGAGVSQSIINTKTSFIGAGSGNLIQNSTGSSIGAGTGNRVLNSKQSLIVGGKTGTVNLSEDSTLIGGDQNQIQSSQLSVLGGGKNNLITGADNSVLLGGSGNTVHSNFSNILGGKSNSITGTFSDVFAGQENNITGDRNEIFAGSGNKIGTYFFEFTGTLDNGTTEIEDASGDATNSQILFGNNNEIYGKNSVVFGDNNIASGESSFIFGGSGNRMFLNFQSGENGFEVAQTFFGGAYGNSNHPEEPYLNNNLILIGKSNSIGQNIKNQRFGARFAGAPFFETRYEATQSKDDIMIGGSGNHINGNNSIIIGGAKNSIYHINDSLYHYFNSVSLRFGGSYPSELTNLEIDDFIDDFNDDGKIFENYNKIENSIRCESYGQMSTISNSVCSIIETGGTSISTPSTVNDLRTSRFCSISNTIASKISASHFSFISNGIKNIITGEQGSTNRIDIAHNYILNGRGNEIRKPLGASQNPLDSYNDIDTTNTAGFGGILNGDQNLIEVTNSCFATIINGRSNSISGVSNRNAAIFGLENKIISTESDKSIDNAFIYGRRNTVSGQKTAENAGETKFGYFVAGNQNKVLDTTNAFIFAGDDPAFKDSDSVGNPLPVDNTITGSKSVTLFHGRKLTLELSSGNLFNVFGSVIRDADRVSAFNTLNSRITGGSTNNLFLHDVFNSTIESCRDSDISHMGTSSSDIKNVTHSQISQGNADKISGIDNSRIIGSINELSGNHKHLDIFGTRNSVTGFSVSGLRIFGINNSFAGGADGGGENYEIFGSGNGVVHNENTFTYGLSSLYGQINSANNLILSQVRGIQNNAKNSDHVNILGNSNVITGVDHVNILGRDNLIEDSTRCSALGANLIMKNANCVEVFGTGNIVSGNDESNKVTNTNIYGNGNKVSGAATLLSIFGSFNDVSGHNNIFGSSNNVSGTNNYILGDVNEVTGNNILIFGKRATSNFNGGSVINDGRLSVSSRSLAKGENTLFLDFESGTHINLPSGSASNTTPSDGVPGSLKYSGEFLLIKTGSAWGKVQISPL
jgi:hypothetical protein